MAAPGFGFSAGDFISGISLVKKLIRSLNDTAGSRTSYRQLISELLDLDEALDQIKDLQADPAQAAQTVGLKQIAARCQLSIETFLSKNSKFNESLGLQPSTSVWKSNLHKIQWALCKDGAIDDLRAEIAAHTTTLNMALATSQLTATRLQGESLDGCRQSLQSVEDGAKESNMLAKLNHQLLTNQADLFTDVSSTLANLSTETQINELQSLVQEVLESNTKILNAIVQAQQFQSSIPPQVEFQQPVIFEDAHARKLPFHLEFVNSFTVFQWLLESRFQTVPGLRKVKNLEYTMWDMASKRAVDLSRPWESAVRPGRRVAMSMVFQRPKASTPSCPGCLAENPDSPGNGDSDVQCSNTHCRIWYRRVTEIDTVRRGKRRLEESRQVPAKRRKIDLGPSRSRECSSESDVEEQEDEVHHFRRVQIVHKEARTPATSSPPTRRGSPHNTPQAAEPPFDTSREGLKASVPRHFASSRMQTDATSGFPSCPPPGPSSQTQQGLTPASNMSIDTDCDRPTPSQARAQLREEDIDGPIWSLEHILSRWDSFTLHLVVARRRQLLGGRNGISARMGHPNTAS